jgi:hypothetical protein
MLPTACALGVDYMYQFTNRTDGELTAGKGKGGSTQQHMLAVCIPDECSNKQDVRRITSDYAHYGLLHYWLASGAVIEPMAPPLDAPAKVVIGVIFGSLAMCILATLVNSNWLETCRAAMPMQENVAKRVKAQLLKYPARALEVRAMAELEQWNFVLATEAAEEGTDQPVGGSTGSIQGASLSVPLMSDTTRPTLEPLSLSKARDPASFCGDFVACWDLGKNWRTGLMKQDGGVPEMRVLNGLRVLSMGWVVLCHGFLYQEIDAGVQNQAFVQVDVARRFISTLLPNGNFSVDTFFVLSGYLGS